MTTTLFEQHQALFTHQTCGSIHGVCMYVYRASLEHVLGVVDLFPLPCVRRGRLNGGEEVPSRTTEDMNRDAGLGRATETQIQLAVSTAERRLLYSRGCATGTQIRLAVSTAERRLLYSRWTAGGGSVQKWHFSAPALPPSPRVCALFVLPDRISLV